MKNQNEYFIRTKGEAEFKTFHLINNETCEMLEIFFNSEIETQHYAEKKSLTLVEYKETFETKENGK
jgi:hypothetical protein